MNQARAVIWRVALPQVLLLTAALPAQEVTYDALVAEHAAAAAAAPDVARAEFLGRFQAAAAAHAGTEAAVPFLIWVVEHDRVGATVEAALDALTRDHAESLGIGRLLDMLPAVASYLDDDRCDRLLAAVLADNPHPELQARALLARAILATCAVGGGGAAQVVEDLENAGKLAKDPALLAAIRGVEPGVRGLAVGDRVPDVAGFDLDGRPLRLSDYRGKVVVLDFWGDW